jgi:D-serine deaminase-like pyridoxal phosphate-dependent protein
VMTHAGESYNCDSTAAIVAMAEQERAGAVRAAERLRAAGFDVPIVGSLLRILPNHACATGAQHTHYNVVEGSNSEVVARWDRINGW